MKSALATANFRPVCTTDEPVRVQCGECGHSEERSFFIRSSCPKCGGAIRMVPLPGPDMPGKRVVVPLWKAMEIASGGPRRTGANARALRELGKRTRQGRSMNNVPPQGGAGSTPPTPCRHRGSTAKVPPQEGAGSTPSDTDGSARSAKAAPVAPPEDMPVWIRCGTCGHSEKRSLFEAGKRCPECGACVSIASNRSHKPPLKSKSQIQRFWRQREHDVSIIPEQGRDGTPTPKKFDTRREGDRQLAEDGGARG